MNVIKLFVLDFPHFSIFFVETEITLKGPEQILELSSFLRQSRPLYSIKAFSVWDGTMPRENTIYS